ncbi:Ig-like domain-containing protein [Cohnella caldifontis]|uniref:Ig-like domain-containing protein n=1 Tax=Cohnella caldifontis TaxID=3027471 RepID=UPI0023EDD8DE|nr:carboxypeptidase regulatory-like domain-containing protein [Cohnella sp. YIM B05605]
MGRRFLAALLTIGLIFQWFSPGVWQSAHAAGYAFGGNLGVTIGSPGKAVLGKTADLEIELSNTTGSMAFNVGVQMILEDGLDLDPSTGTAASETETASNGTKTLYWRDMKDLAPDETFTFPVKLLSKKTYRASGEDVDFGATPKVTVRLVASSDARHVMDPPNFVSVPAEETLQIVPFTVTIEHDGKNVKGAGPSSAAPDSGDEWGALSYKLVIDNNDRSPTKITNLTNETDGALETYDYSLAPSTPHRIAGDKRQDIWNSITLAVGEKKEISFKAAYLEKQTAGGVANAGPVVKDGYGSDFYQKVTYGAEVDGADFGTGSVEYKAVSKDIIVTKTTQVPAGGIEYGSELEYVLTVKTNEYEAVTGVTLTDTIGDGQTFVGYTGEEGTEGTPSNPAKTVGMTELTWELGDLGPHTVVTRSYTVKVDEFWSGGKYGTGPVFAGDELVNSTMVTGYSSSGKVTDTDGTVVWITEPGIGESIVGLNGDTLDSVPHVDTTVGDIVTFDVEYDASKVGAQQHDVMVFDYLPLGTELVGDPSDYTLNGEVPEYDAAQNRLLWDLGDVGESAGTQSVQIKVKVLNDTDHVKAEKGAENLVVLTYTDSAGHVQSQRSSVKLNYVEPYVELDRSVDNTPENGPPDTPVKVDGGQIVKVTLKLTNTGSSPAYNVAVTEPLASGLANPREEDGTPIALVGGSIEFPPVSTLGIGSTDKSVELTYLADVIDPIGAEREIRQGASWTYQGRADASGRGYPDGEETDHVTMQAQTLKVTKSFFDSATGGKDDLRVGDWVVYQVTAALPAGKAAHFEAWDGVLTDFLPKNQSLTAVFSDFDKNLDSGTPIPSSGYTSNAGDNSVSVAGVKLDSSNPDYTIFVKTRVDKLDAGKWTESPSSKASFVWNDQNGGGGSHTANSGSVTVTVSKPNLTASFDRASIDLGLEDSQDLTFTVTNSGPNTAFDFTPNLTIPPGFEIEAKAGTTIADKSGDATSGYTVKMPIVPNLAKDESKSYSFTIKLVGLNGSGSEYQVVGKTGAYYATEAAYTSDPDQTDLNGDATASEEKFRATTTAKILVPLVKIDNQIESTTNGTSLAKIRPGDVVNYKLTVTVPKGTKAYALNVTDKIGGSGAFDWWNGTAWVTSPGTITLDLGDVDASDAQQPIEKTVKLRAKADGSSPANGSYKTTAQAHWLSVSGDSASKKDSAEKETSIQVVQPDMTLAPDALAAAQFDDDHPSITVGFKLGAVTGPDAYKAEVNVPIPAELNVVEGTITEGGTFEDGAVVWTGLNVTGGSTKTLKFDVEPAPGAGAGASGITLTATLTQFDSTPGDQTDQLAKTYAPNKTASQTLSIKPAALTATVQSNPYLPDQNQVRPGDPVSYRVSIDLPEGRVAYDSVLTVETLTNQTIDGVTVDGTPVAYSAEAGGYPLGRLNADAEVLVNARISTTGSHSGPYTAQFEPRLAYETASTGGSALTAVTSVLQLDVVEPDLSIQLTAEGPTVLDAIGDTVPFRLAVKNNGAGPAYLPHLTLTVPDGFALSAVGAPGDPTVTASVYGFDWQPLSIPAGGTLELTFHVGASNETAVHTAIQVQATLNAYQSLPVDGGKTYGPLTTDQIGVEVSGAHQLLGSDTRSIRAGQSTAFDHTLRNTGAGRDIYVLTLDSPFPVTLLKDGVEIARGAKSGSAWVWTSIADGYRDADDAGQVAVALNGGETAGLRLQVQVPENTPYGGAPAVIEIAAHGKLNGTDSAAEDRITVIGDHLDGWSGSQPYENWRQPAYRPGDTAALKAVTSVHITSVKAHFFSEAGGGATSGQSELVLENEKTYLEDGYKVWVGSAVLPKDSETGRYAIRFEAYQDGVLKETDDTATSGTGANNPFIVQRTAVLRGTVFDAATRDVIAGAVVKLRDPANSGEDRETTTDADGKYGFSDIDVRLYEILVADEGYADAEAEVYAIPDASGTVTQDVYLSPYRLTLSADPNSLLGDGLSETTLTAEVLDLEGHPLAGVPVVFSSPSGKGTFVGGTGAVTGADGKARVQFRSDVVTGAEAQQFPVRIDVNDPVHDLFASDQIVIHFDPGAVTGFVTEMVNGVSTPVPGAFVTIRKISTATSRSISKRTPSPKPTVPIPWPSRKATRLTTSSSKKRSPSGVSGNRSASRRRLRWERSRRWDTRYIPRTNRPAASC